MIPVSMSKKDVDIPVALSAPALHKLVSNEPYPGAGIKDNGDFILQSNCRTGCVASRLKPKPIWKPADKVINLIFSFNSFRVW